MTDHAAGDSLKKAHELRVGRIQYEGAPIGFAGHDHAARPDDANELTKHTSGILHMLKGPLDSRRIERSILERERMSVTDE